MKKEKLINIENVKIGMWVSLPSSLNASMASIKVNSIKKEKGFIILKGNTGVIKREVGKKVSI
jgi:hypothetical protein